MATEAQPQWAAAPVYRRREERRLRRAYSLYPQRGKWARQFTVDEVTQQHFARFHTQACMDAGTYLTECDCTGKPNVPAETTICLYMGDRGSGKSLSATAAATDSFRLGLNVVHNSALYFGQEWSYRDFTRNRYDNSVIVIDEIEEYLNSMRVNTGGQVDAVSTLIQLRHQGCQILATTQYPDEVNRRFLRRVDWGIYCNSSDGGRSVHQTWVFKPFHPNRIRAIRNRRLLKAKKIVLKNGWQFFNLYHHKRYVDVGRARLTAAEQRANDEIDDKELVFSLLVQAAIEGQPTVNATAIQMAARQQSEGFSRSARVIESWLKQFPGVEYVKRSPDRAFLVPEKYRTYASNGGVA